MKDKLYGDDVVISKVLDKIELALRRASAKWASPAAYGLDMVADEIAKINKDMWND